MYKSSNDLLWRLFTERCSMPPRTSSKMGFDRGPGNVAAIRARFPRIGQSRPAIYWTRYPALSVSIFSRQVNTRRRIKENIQRIEEIVAKAHLKLTLINEWIFCLLFHLCVIYQTNSVNASLISIFSKKSEKDGVRVNMKKIELTLLNNHLAFLSSHRGTIRRDGKLCSLKVIGQSSPTLSWAEAPRFQSFLLRHKRFSIFHGAR